MKNSNAFLIEPENAPDFRLLSRKERVEVMELMEARESLLAAPEAQGDLAAFGRAVFPLYEVPWHIRLLCDELQRVEQTLNDRLMVFAPPRHGKSQTCSINFPAWYLGRNPQHSVIGTSYSDDRANSFSRACRETINTPMYQRIWPYKLSAEGVQGWQIKGKIDQRFSYISAGVGGGLAGEGANLLIIDDPIKDRAEAESLLIRDKKWDWFQSVARTRLQPGGRIVFVTTRWDEDDPAGRALAQAKADPKSDQWRLIILPAQNDGGDCIPEDLPPYRALWPEFYPEDALEKTKATIGPWVWSALYQQRPSPRAGRMIQREWLRYWHAGDLPDDLDSVAISGDLSFKDAEESSRVALTVWGWKGARRFLLHEICGKADFLKTQTWVIEICAWVKARYKHANIVWIEDKANGPAIMNSLRDALPAWAFLPHDPKGSKTARMFAEQPTFQAGNVFLPDPLMPGYAWVNEHVDELCRFPAEPNDRGDSDSQALFEIRMGVDAFSRYLELSSANSQAAMRQGTSMDAPAFNPPGRRHRA